jgi:hypothetical protein
VIIIIPSINRAERQRLFHGALDELSRFGELINRVLEVDMEGEKVRFDFYELPRGAACKLVEQRVTS